MFFFDLKKNIFHIVKHTFFYMNIATPIITLDLIKQKFSTFQLMCTYYFTFFKIVFAYFSVCTNELNVFFIFCRFSRWCWDRRYRTFMKDIKFYIVNTAKPAHTGTCSKMSTVLNGHTFLVLSWKILYELNSC